jgi:hypothetical protein
MNPLILANDAVSTVDIIKDARRQYFLLDSINEVLSTSYVFFFLGAAAPIWAMAYLHETLRFTSVF